MCLQLPSFVILNKLQLKQVRLSFFKVAKIIMPGFSVRSNDI